MLIVYDDASFCKAFSDPMISEEKRLKCCCYFAFYVYPLTNFELVGLSFNRFIDFLTPVGFILFHLGDIIIEVQIS